jgi:hypothetical protein
VATHPAAATDRRSNATPSVRGHSPNRDAMTAIAMNPAELLSSDAEAMSAARSGKPS